MMMPPPPVGIFDCSVTIAASTIEIGDAFPFVDDDDDDDASFVRIAIIIVAGHVVHVRDELRAPQQAIRRVVIPRPDGEQSQRVEEETAHFGCIREGEGASAGAYLGDVQRRLEYRRAAAPNCRRRAPLPPARWSTSSSRPVPDRAIRGGRGGLHERVAVVVVVNVVPRRRVSHERLSLFANGRMTTERMKSHQPHNDISSLKRRSGSAIYSR